LLEKEFYSWKGKNVQTDDVLVAGFRVPGVGLRAKGEEMRDER